MVKGSFCALTGRAAFLFRGNVTISLWQGAQGIFWQKQQARSAHTATATVESGRQQPWGVALRVPGDPVRTRYLQTRTSLDIEKGGLPSHQLQQRFPRLGMGQSTGAWRPQGPPGVRPPEGLCPETPAPHRHAGQGVSVDICTMFRGGKHRGYGDTPSRRLLQSYSLRTIVYRLAKAKRIVFIDASTNSNG
jgi:hypothetical protein